MTTVQSATVSHTSIHSGKMHSKVAELYCLMHTMHMSNFMTAVTHAALRIAAKITYFVRFWKTQKSSLQQCKKCDEMNDDNKESIKKHQQNKPKVAGISSHGSHKL